MCCTYTCTQLRRTKNWSKQRPLSLTLRDLRSKASVAASKIDGKYASSSAADLFDTCNTSTVEVLQACLCPLTLDR